MSFSFNFNDEDIETDQDEAGASRAIDVGEISDLSQPVVEVVNHDLKEMVGTCCSL